MTAADDLIRRQDAVNCIRNAMKHIYTAARKTGYKESIDLLSRLPAAKAKPYTMAEPVYISPGLGHSHWFISGGFRLCDNCGGEGDLRRETLFCPHCGFIMDALEGAEIE